MPWLTLSARVIAVGLLVVGVEQLAHSRPALGGALTTFPLFSFAALTLLSLDGAPKAHLTAFATAAAIGLIAAGAALTTTAVLLHRAFALPGALLASALAWTVAAALLAAWRP